MVLSSEPVQLTSHDIRNEECISVWNQKLIRQGLIVDGYWGIEIIEAGEYKFSLRRWPKSENRPIDEGIDGEDIEFRKDFIQQNDCNQDLGFLHL